MPIQKAIDIPAFLALSPRERVLKMLKTIGLDEEFYDLEEKGAILERDRFAASKAKSEAKVRLRNIPDRVLPDDLKEEDSILAALGENLRRCRERADLAGKTLRLAEKDLVHAENRRDEYMPEVMAKKEAELEGRRRKAHRDFTEAEENELAIVDHLSDTAEKLDQLSKDHPMQVHDVSIEGGDLKHNGAMWGKMHRWEQALLAAEILRGTPVVLIDKSIEQMSGFQRITAWAEDNGATLVLKED